MMPRKIWMPRAMLSMIALALAGVPDAERALVVGVEAVLAPEHAVDLALAVSAELGLSAAGRRGCRPRVAEDAP